MFGIVVLTIACFCMSMGKELISLQRHYEFEDILSDEQLKRTPSLWRFRGQASGNRTLYLIDENENSKYLIQFSLCIFPVDTTGNVKFGLDDILYSNDGPSDAVTVTIDRKPLGKFSTEVYPWKGHEWNVFMNSKPIGEKIELKHGIHTLGITVKTDKWGVEFDKIRVTAENQNPDVNLICGGILKEKKSEKKNQM